MDQKDVNTNDKPLYYSNIVSIESSNYDLFMHFGIKKDRSIPELTDNDIDFSVVMSMQHAKALYNVLGDNLRKYEETFGKIIIEPLSNE